jgi:hypothetical protein
MLAQTMTRTPRVSKRALGGHPLAPVAVTVVSALFFLALCLRRILGEGGVGVVAAPIEDFLGFAPALVLFALTSAWGSIWWLTGEIEDLGKRVSRIFLLVLCVAILVNLNSDGGVTRNGGWFGFQLASRIQSAFGYGPSVFVMMVLTLASLALATDMGFSRYLGPIDPRARGAGKDDLDLPRRSGPIARPGEGVENAAVEHFKTLSSAFEPAVPRGAVAPEAVDVADLDDDEADVEEDRPRSRRRARYETEEAGFRVVGRRRGEGRISIDDGPVDEDSGGGDAGRRARRARRAAAEETGAEFEGALAEHEAELRAAVEEVHDAGARTADDDADGIGVEELAFAAGESFDASDSAADVSDDDDEDDDLLAEARAAAEDARSVLRAQSRKVFGGDFFDADEPSDTEGDEGEDVFEVEEVDDEVDERDDDAFFDDAEDDAAFGTGLDLDRAAAAAARSQPTAGDAGDDDDELVLDFGEDDEAARTTLTSGPTSGEGGSADADVEEPRPGPVDAASAEAETLDDERSEGEAEADAAPRAGAAGGDSGAVGHLAADAPEQGGADELADAEVPEAPGAAASRGEASAEQPAEEGGAEQEDAAVEEPQFLIPRPEPEPQPTDASAPSQDAEPGRGRRRRRGGRRGRAAHEAGDEARAASPSRRDREDRRQGRLFAEPTPEELSADLVDEAAELVIRSHRASADLLRRRLRVDRDAARNLLGRLHDLGVVDLPKGAEHGDVLLDLETWRARRGPVEGDAQTDD